MIRFVVENMLEFVISFSRLIHSYLYNRITAWCDVWNLFKLFILSPFKFAWGRIKASAKRKSIRARQALCGSSSIEQSDLAEILLKYTLYLNKMYINLNKWIQMRDLCHKSITLARRLQVWPNENKRLRPNWGETDFINY